MWKYQCKKHVMVILVSFVAGAVLFGLMGYQREYLTSLLRQSVPAEMAGELIKAEYMYYLIGGLTISGLANGLMLLTYVMQRFNIPFILMFFLFFAGGFTIIEMIGALTVIPAIAVCIFGMLTIPNRGKRREFAKENVTSVAEVERVYRLHHQYLDAYEELGKKAWSFNLKMNLLYFTGLIAVLLVILYVQDFFVVFIAMMLYSILFFQLTKRKNQSMQPIISLLYDQCYPEACATAIFAYAKKGRRKKSFPMPQHLAQCMVYLNDPHLAIDVLATSAQGRGNFIFAYHSLMAYAYYQLGDRSMVKFHYDECEKAGARVNNGPMQMIKAQCLEGIQNKLDLMDQNFESSRSFFEKAMPTAGFEFQRVDFKYYLGLIGFVQKDLDEAKSCFSYVVQHGNKIYYVEKAQSFLKTIEKAEAAMQAQYDN